MAKVEFTVKDLKHKTNSEGLKELVDKLPKVYKTVRTAYAIPGYLYLNHGIEYFRGEKIDPCKDYMIEQLEFQLIDKKEILTILKREVQDRGESGLKFKIQTIQGMHQVQKMNYPKLFEN